MKSADFLSLAVRLSNSTEEANLRTSVSRSYYGAYHAALEFIESCGVVLPESGDSHQKLRWCLDQAGHVEARSASRQLNSLRVDRNEADYDLRSQRFCDRRDVVIPLQSAQDVVDAVARCAVDPDFAVIRDRIRSYARDILKLPLSGP